MPTNEERANRIAPTLDFYKHEMLGEAGNIHDAEYVEFLKDTITDLLTDLRHFCDQQNINYSLCSFNSDNHFLEEREEQK